MAAAVSDVVSNGTKRSVRLLVDQAANKAAPTASTDGVACYVRPGQEVDAGLCFGNRDSGQATLMISGTGYVQAELDLATKTTNVNTVIRAVTAGPSGTAITFATLNDGSGVGSITRSGTAFTFHYQSGVTTVANLEAAIAALTGADALIQVKTAGTGANIMAHAVDTFTATALALPSNTLVGTFTLWGYLNEAAAWFKISVNGGSALAETGTDQIGYQERFSNLGHYDRIDIQLASIGGTNSKFNAWLVTGRYGE